MRLYIIALQFLTIIPLPFNTNCRKDDLGRSLAVFPLAGATIGVLLAGLDWLLTPWLARPLVDALLITILSLVTGALHLDGVGDVFDGLAARGGRERFLAVMKDSHVGAAGVVGIVLVLLLKWQALVALPAELKWPTLIFFPLLARFSQVQTIVYAVSARQEGLGSSFVGGAGTLQLLLAGGITLVAAWLLPGLKGLVVLAVIMVFTWLLKRWCHCRLGGITGDIIGCINELNEILALLLLSALPRF